MNRLPPRRVVIAGAAAAAALAALKKPAQAQTVTPAELAKHEKYMRLAIAQAHRNPGRPFGSVIVDERTGEVVGEGVVNMGANPMYHSEIVAMNDYIAKHGNKGWENLTMYGSDTPFVRQFVNNINIRAKDVVAAAQALYTNQLLLGGVLASVTDKMFEERGKVGGQK